MTHVLQPIDVACARSFKAALGPEIRRRQNNRDLQRPITAACHRDILVRGTLAAVSHCNLTICENGYATAGIYPWDRSKPLASKYVRKSPYDAEREDEAKKPQYFHCGCSAMTSEKFLQDIG
jgi:hypothetical protein